MESLESLKTDLIYINKAKKLNLMRVKKNEWSTTLGTPVVVLQGNILGTILYRINKIIANKVHAENTNI